MTSNKTLNQYKQKLKYIMQTSLKKSKLISRGPYLQIRLHKYCVCIRPTWYNMIVENLIIEPYVGLGCWLSITIPNFGQNRNSRWRLSAILDFPKFYFWPMGLLRPLIFHLVTIKFGAKMLIDAQIKAQNQNSRWRPSAILEFLYHQIGPPTKSFRWATSACQILC